MIQEIRRRRLERSTLRKIDVLSTLLIVDDWCYKLCNANLFHPRWVEREKKELPFMNTINESIDTVYAVYTVCYDTHACT